MEIEFILTFASKPQKIVEYPFVNPILKDKKTLFDFATAQLRQDEKKELLKISSCVYIGNSASFEEADWFMECNGKLFIKDIKELLK